MAVRLQRAHTQAKDADQAAAELRAALPEEGALTLVFASSGYDLDRLGPALSTLPGPVVGCTTAGEIGPGGFEAGGVAAAVLVSDNLEARSFTLPDLVSPHESIQEIARECAAIAADLGPRERLFGLLLVDGLSEKEELLTAEIFASLGDVPIVGGSAGDELQFVETRVLSDGVFRSGTAVFTLVRTSESFRAFKLQHHVASEQRMVVTGACAASRLVTEIDGLPAAEAYAGLVGVDVEELTPEVFSSHPLILKLGDQEHIRAIASVVDGTSLKLLASIERGIVLHLGRLGDAAGALARDLAAIEESLGGIAGLITCDCILRRLEFERIGLSDKVGAMLNEANAIGFHTYGEQTGPMHVNQTLVGIAFGAAQ